MKNKSQQRSSKKINIKDGGTIDFDADPWNFRGPTLKVNFTFFDLNVGRDLRESVKNTLAWYLENRSLNHSKSIYERLKHFTRFNKNGPFESITDVDLINFKSSLDESHQWYLGTLRGFFKKLYRSGFPGVEESAIHLLEQIKIKGNKKGEAVRTADPNIGSYTEIESQTLFREIKNKFHTNEVSLKEFCLFWLFLAFGMRNIQYAQMKVCDIKVIEGGDGTNVYTISIPEAKKRGLPRATFLEMRLDPNAGIYIHQYANEVREQYSKQLANPELLPLFPGEFNKNDVNGFDGHLTTSGIAYILKGIERKLDVISPRTGERINISAVRFRRTIGTRAAEEGHGLLTIAALLNHTDTQNASVYIEATSTIIDKIDKAIAFKIAPLAQAFKGKLIAGPSQASRSEDPTSIIRSPKIDPSCKPMGNCGEFGFCNLMAPIACYTCSNFEPWLDGPHEKVLDFLLTERERLCGGSDPRIAAINDQTILAVTQVIQICNKQLGYSDE